MRLKYISAAAAIALLLTVGVAAAPAATSVAAQNAPSSGTQAPRHGGVHFAGDFGAMKVLSTISGMSMEDLMAKYPQKTSWQIAKQIGKLDDLKKGYLEAQKTFLNRLVSEGRLSADESSKIYADLQKRVAAIDGVNTVTLGRPGYRPQLKAKN